MHPLFSDFSNSKRCKRSAPLKDPTYAIFLKSIGFKDINYDISVCHEAHEGHAGHAGHEGHEE